MHNYHSHLPNTVPKPRHLHRAWPVFLSRQLLRRFLREKETVLHYAAETSEELGDPDSSNYVYDLVPKGIRFSRPNGCNQHGLYRGTVEAVTSGLFDDP